jgi:hypothetical protein
MQERFVAIDNVCAWPALTLLPDGTVIAVIFNQPSHLLAEGDVECWASTDDGRLWRRRGTAAVHEDGTARANVAAGLAHNGDLIVLSSGWGYVPALRDRILPPWICRSSDGGASWSADTRTRSIVQSAHPLIPFGAIAVLPGDRLAASCYQQHGTSLVLFSADDGRTWTESAVISDRCRSETAILRLRADRWLAAARTGTDAEGRMPDVGMELYVSGDEGRTWSDAGTLTGPSQHPGHLLALEDGQVLLTFGMRDLKAIGTRMSADQGATWGEARVLTKLETEDEDLGYPSTVELADGTLLTAYYARGIVQHGRYHMATVRWRR